MSTPRPEDRRLGLLQCPNAASRGWASVTSEANDDPLGNEDDDNADHAAADGVDESATLAGAAGEGAAEEMHVDVMKTVDVDSSTPTEPMAVSESKPDLSTDCEAAAAEPAPDSSLEKDVREIVVENSSMDDASVPKEASAFEDKEIDGRASKRLRTDDGPVDAFTNENEIQSCQNDSMGDASVAKAETIAEQSVSIAEQMMASESKPHRTEEANTGNPLTISLEYESSCSCSHCTKYQQSNEESTNMPSDTVCNNERGQVLTITYRCGSQSQQIIQLGSISGRAKLELLDHSDGFSDRPKEEIEAPSVSGPPKIENHDLDLDVFGYRLSLATNNIHINRPEWMNALPLSLVCPKSPNDDTKTIRVRIKSIHDNDITTSKEEDSYYSSHREESYQIEIYPQLNGSIADSKNERKSGVTFISDPWRITTDKILTAVHHGVPSKRAASQVYSNYNRILVCGAKGVGKSTFLRYMTNRMLSSPQQLQLFSSNKQRVAILDLDSGQPELSPPGLLTLTIVSSPIVSDPPLHMVCRGQCNTLNDKDTAYENGIVEDVVASYFFGEVTSKSDPDAYIQIANKMMYKYQEFCSSTGEEYNSLPLIVNTDGWVKGLGYEILSAIIGICNPGHIVQILGNTKAKSFDMTSFHTGNADSQLNRCVHAIQSFDECTNPVLDDGYKRGSLDSQSVTTGPLLATASDHRHHRICAYFLGGCSRMSLLKSGKVRDDSSLHFHKEKGLVDPSNVIGLTMASMPPYAVPFHVVNLYPPSGLLDSVTEIENMWGVDAELACNDVLDSLCGSIVGLCCNPNPPDPPNNTNFNAGSGLPILPCVGLGIIRSIDITRKIFYVLTPVEPSLLADVTSFVGGNIGLPLECVYRGIYSDSFPYISFGQAVVNPGLGSEVMKSRNHSGRKR